MSPRRDLSDAVVVVTGAGRGMGKAFAERLASEPVAAVLYAVRRPSEVDLPTPPPGGARRVAAIPLDLGSPGSIEASYAAWTNHTDRVDVLVNNAGQLTSGVLSKQPIEGILNMLQVNLVGLIHLTRLVLPGMLDRRRGLIVNNASISGYAWFPATSSYAATKAGTVAFSEALRRELLRTEVDVMHLVTPRIETEMAEQMDQQYAGLVNTRGFASMSSEEWAEKVVRAILKGDHIVGPGGRTAIAKLLSRGPAWLLDRVSLGMFTPPRDWT